MDQSEELVAFDAKDYTTSKHELTTDLVTLGKTSQVVAESPFQEVR